MNNEEQLQAPGEPEPGEETPATQERDFEKVVESYFDDEPAVRTLIHVNVDTKYADTIAQQLADLDEITDVLLVTGDIDLVVKARFDSYTELKNFILKEISGIKGIKETKTFLIVSTYKILGRKP